MPMTDADLPARLLRPDPERGSRAALWLSWLVILLVGGYVVAVHNTPRATVTAAASTQAVQPPGLLQSLARAAVGGETADVRRQLLESAGNFATGPMDQARLAVIRAEVLGRDDGLRYLDAIIERTPASPARDDMAALARLVRDAPSQQPPDAPTLEALRARQGFFVDVALAVGKPDGDPARAAMLRASRGAFGVMIAATGGILLLLILALAMFIVGVVVLCQGRLRRAFVPPWRAGSVYAEAFALFLLLFVGYSWFIAEVQPPALLSSVLRWGLLLVALWPLVRGQSWTQTRTDLGWHAGGKGWRGVLREMGAGVTGYLACLPIVGVGVVITLVLGALRMWMTTPDPGAVPTPGGGTPLPVHPLGDQVSRGAGLQVVDLVILATLWAPIVEETVFRGALYRHVRGWAGVFLAALIVGVIFAAIHPQGWTAIPALCSIAMVFALLREWRGSLIAPITAHALNNGLIVGLLLLLTSA